MPIYLERALFIVGQRNAGKSTALRSMLLDRRLGAGGTMPGPKKINATYWLSNERRLHIRATSPHEYGDSPKDFIARAHSHMPSGRWCFACPLQPGSFGNMPDAVTTIAHFDRAFGPERIRVALLDPDRNDGEWPVDPVKVMRDLHALGSEVMRIDAARKDANGLLLADFFDFT
jgi:hypothetical protein